MHSTDGMPPLAIPLRRAQQRAFWCVAAAGSAVATAVLTWSAGWEGVALYAAAVPALIVAPALAVPTWFENGVRAWNAGTRHVSGALRSYVLFVCYYTLFGAIRLVDAPHHSLQRAPRDAGWIERVHTSGDALSWCPSRADEALLAYARSRGDRMWSLVLVPIVLLLALLGDGQHENPPSRTSYTLY